MSKLFSVVICTYNGSKNIQEVLDAICMCNQVNNLVEEVIVVDNASTDSTAAIVKEYMKSHPIIKYEYEGKSGLSFARKHALNTQAPWVIYFDDDNLPGDNWFVGAAKYIAQNDEVGVFGGRNIAMIREDLTEEMQRNLFAMKSNLACHYCSYEDYLNNQNGSALESVFGAGMTIKRDILVRFNECGWMLGKGRTKNNLSAYEDSEIVNYAIKLGYKKGNCDRIYLKHIIPKSRLETKYIEKLRRGMEDSEYYVVMKSENALVRRTRLLIRDIAKVLKYTVVCIVYKDKVKKTFGRYIIKSGCHNLFSYPSHVVNIVLGKHKVD